MKIAINIFLLVFTLLIANSCQNKELDLNLVETACKNFKIHSPGYAWVTDPSCGGTSLNATLQLSFKFDGDLECIDRIYVDPKLYKSNNAEIGNVSFANTFLKTDTLVNIVDHSVTLSFKFAFANATDADNFNHIYLKLHTENELGNKSKNLELRINATCSTVDPTTYGVIKEITVSTSTVDIFLKDHGSEDGDIISIYLNGFWVMENYTLTNKGETFTFSVNKGDNHIVLFAVNEGKVGPNTVSMSINGTEINISPDLLKGEAVNVKRF